MRIVVGKITDPVVIEGWDKAKSLEELRNAARDALEEWERCWWEQEQERFLRNLRAAISEALEPPQPAAAAGSQQPQ
jgi:hypothetical protein